MDNGMRFMVAPRSAKAKHSSILEKSHGMRNLPGSLSFSGNFLRRTIEQCSFSGVLANLNSFSLLVNKLLMVGLNLGKRMRASAKLMLGFGALTGASKGSTTGATTGLEFSIRVSFWTTRGWTSLVLPLLVEGIVSFVTSVSRSTTLGGEENPLYRYKFLTTDANATPITPGNKGTLQPQQPKGEVMETFSTIPEDILKWITTKAEAIQIILTRIDSDIYSTVDACSNAIEMWKAIKRFKQVYHSQTHPTYYTQSSSTRSQASTKNKGKAIFNPPQRIYDPKPEVVVDGDASSKEKEFDKNRLSSCLFRT
nr:hypothetical protein [Tanacetum cinerariifolium]